MFNIGLQRGQKGKKTQKAYRDAGPLDPRKKLEDKRQAQLRLLDLAAAEAQNAWNQFPNVDYSGYKCFRCGEMGHMITGCHDYICPHCNIAAPNHRKDWCPANPAVTCPHCNKSAPCHIAAQCPKAGTPTCYNVRGPRRLAAAVVLTAQTATVRQRGPHCQLASIVFLFLKLMRCGEP